MPLFMTALLISMRSEVLIRSLLSSQNGLTRIPILRRPFGLTNLLDEVYVFHVANKELKRSSRRQYAKKRNLI